MDFLHIAKITEQQIKTHSEAYAKMVIIYLLSSNLISSISHFLSHFIIYIKHKYAYIYITEAHLMNAFMCKFKCIHFAIKPKSYSIAIFLKMFSVFHEHCHFHVIENLHF